MKNLWKCVSGLCTVMALGFTAANAQTIANGPYYATPSWDQTLPAASRFIVLSNFSNAAVLDRETGLVWARSPFMFKDYWIQASYRCSSTTIGNRKAWRLPSLEELQSLMDPSVASPGLALPPGHPFTSLPENAFYWTSTVVDYDPTKIVYVASFMAGGNWAHLSQNSLDAYGWCVRGA